MQRRPELDYHSARHVHEGACSLWRDGTPAQLKHPSPVLLPCKMQLCCLPCWVHPKGDSSEMKSAAHLAQLGKVGIWTAAGRASACW